MTPLHRLARAAGLSVRWTDAAGAPHQVSDDTLVAVLAALGLPADSPAQIRESRAQLAEGDAAPLVTAELGETVTLPGGRQEAFDTPGYHDRDGITVAVAPPRGFTPADAAPGRRLWGPAVQIPSLIDRRQAAFGDFGALATFARAAGQAGADALAISPVHALFPGDPTSFSPYGPSTRLWLNVLLGDPALAGGAAEAAPAAELIDWHAAIPARMALLRRLYDGRTDATRQAVAAFAAAQGEALARHATFDALLARFGTGWTDWPADYRDPGGAAVRSFAAEQADEIGFYTFLQWLADASLAKAQAEARGAGMAIGLIADMAVGMSAGGSQAWSRPDGLLSGASVGAPPDPLGPAGQDWGIVTFSPRGLRRTGYRDFIDTIRAALRHAGGIRIDHAMSLKRLWVVPPGAAATEGVYLGYPQTDLMRLLALESWRAKAIVVGEDLGTVPPGFRAAMTARGFLGMRVLAFERSRGGGFRAPARYPAEAAAMSSTHDLPTLAGWWQGRDLDWAERLGRGGGAEARAARAQDRARLWRACRAAGVASGPLPDAPGPAIDAALAFVAATPSVLALLPIEDLLGLEEQPNLPGTIDAHPNWRRRVPAEAETLLGGIGARIEAINARRRA